MPAPRKTEPFVLADAILKAYATNDRINRYLIENLDEEAWRAEPPGGKGRTIAAIVAHLHSVRVMLLRVAAKGSEIPEQLDRHTATQTQALAALTKSHDAMARLLNAALTGDGRIKGFRPDVAGFIGYLLAHDAHPLSQKAMFEMWEWGTR